MARTNCEKKPNTEFEDGCDLLENGTFTPEDKALLQYIFENEDKFSDEYYWEIAFMLNKKNS